MLLYDIHTRMYLMLYDAVLRRLLYQNNGRLADVSWSVAITWARHA